MITGLARYRARLQEGSLTQHRCLGRWTAHIQVLLPERPRCLGRVWRTGFGEHAVSTPGLETLRLLPAAPSTGQRKAANCLGPHAGPGPSHGLLSAGPHTNSSTPCGHPKLALMLVGEDGHAEDEALRGLGNCFSDFF